MRDCISMCFDICTINIRVSIRVRGLHLVLGIKRKIPKQHIATLHKTVLTLSFVVFDFLHQYYLVLFISFCGGILNLDGHAQIKKCPKVTGFFHASVVLLAWPLHKRMTRTFGWLKKEAAAAASGFSPVWGSQVMSPSAPALG